MSLENFQIDPSWEDFGKVEIAIDPAWEDFGRLEEPESFEIDPDFGKLEEQEEKVEEERLEKEVDLKIDPAWEDFGHLTDEQRLEERLEEEQVFLNIKDIFGEKFRYLKGLSLHTQALNRLAPDLMCEIKKVLEKDETIAFFDYTYGISKSSKEEFTTLNYLNIITHKGHIYSVKFKHQFTHDLVGINSWTMHISVPVNHPYPHTTHPYYYNIMVEKKHTFHPTKRNLDMLKNVKNVINVDVGDSEIFKVLASLK